MPPGIQAMATPAGIVPAIIFQLLAAFVAAKTAGYIFTRFRMPAVTGELIAGILLGPYVLNIIHFNDPAMRVTFETIAEISVIILLFSIGLETNISEMKKTGWRSFLVASAGVIVPFLLGFAYMKVTGHNGMASLFMGAVMTATSVGITARILKELDFLSADVSRIIIGAAVIDDILGLMILSAISSIQLNGGVQTASLLTSAIVIFIFVFVFTVGGAAAAKKFGNKISALNMRNAPLIVAVVVCFIYSIIANETGLAAIVGAFMAGMVFSGTKPGIEAQGKVEFINDLVSVFFFVIMGTKVDPHFFLERGIIIPGLIFTVLAFVGKFAGCGLPVLNYGIKKASFIGLAMVPRGEVGIIIAAFALGRGIIGEGLYAMAVFMVLFTSLIPPLFMEPMIKGIKKAG